MKHQPLIFIYRQPDPTVPDGYAVVAIDDDGRGSVPALGERRATGRGIFVVSQVRTLDDETIVTLDLAPS